MSKPIQYLLYFILWLSHTQIASQSLVLESDLNINPRRTNFTGHDFRSNEQFYSMTEDKDGILYFGNNDGVLVFNGERWYKVPLPNNSPATSLVRSEEGQIYAGGFNEIGQVQKDSLGGFYFESIKNNLKVQDKDLDYLWQAHAVDRYLVFRSFGELIIITEGTAIHIKPNNFFSYSAMVDGRFYVMDYGNGLMELDLESLQLRPFLSSKPADLNYTIALLPSNDEDVLYIATKFGKIYAANRKTGLISLWKSIFKDQVNELTAGLKYDGNYLFGTQASEIIVLTQEGDITKNHPAFEKINNSTIVSFYKTGSNFWVLTNSGLVFLEFDLPDFHLFDKASVYDILIDENQLYLATNTGVFVSDLSAKNSENYRIRFSKIPDFDGQVWSVQKHEGHIVLSGHNGLYYLDNGIPKAISVNDSFWKILPTSDSGGTYLAASYNGLYPLKFTDNSWQAGPKLLGFQESSRDIIKGNEDHTYWVCHGYKGVFRLKLTEDLSRVYALEHFTEKNGFDSPYNINVTRYGDNIIFTSNTGIFSFDELKNQFVPFEPLNKILDPQFNTTKILKQQDRTWFVQNDQFGYFESADDKDVSIHKSLFLNLKGKLNRSMESFEPLSNGRVLIGANDGLYLYQTKKKVNKKLKTALSGISYHTDGIEGWLKLPVQTKPELSHEMDMIRFEFCTPGISLSVKKQYQYLLENIDNGWSEWSDNNFKEYTYLKPGEYVFKVRSRNMNGQTGGMTAYAFSIPKAWYQTNLAYVIFTFFMGGLIFFTVFLFGRRVKKKIQKEKDAALRSKRLLELEIEQLKLKQRSQHVEQQKLKLEGDLKSQQMELANYTMLLVKKKEIIFEVFDKLRRLSKSVSQSGHRKTINDLISKIRQHRIGEEYMEVFDVNFEKVHVDFFNKLLKINPELTKRELRLCAFVKMDLSNKEIAPLLNISVRGVETGRYRVRKKLGIQDKNFKNYLDGLSNTFDMKETKPEFKN